MSETHSVPAGFWNIVPSPVGRLLMVVDQDGSVVRLTFLGTALPPPSKAGPELVHDPQRCAHVTQQLDEYFDGQRRRFELEVAPAGTAFQRRVWSEVTQILYGTTISYGDVAARLGNPGAARAVGAANGRNPIPIVIPCHRVVGADGSLAGYGGGVHIKAALLELEGALPPLAHQPRLTFDARKSGER